jgi:cation transport ATPase
MRRLSNLLRQFALLLTALVALAVGGMLHGLGLREAAGWTWFAPTLLVLLSSAASVIRGLMRGQIGVDVIAVLAMAGALLLAQPLTGAIIAVMLTGGGSLERFAVERARRELRALLERAPRVAHRRQGTGVIDVGIDTVAIGDVLMVKPGEVIPADGLVRSDAALLDESALTGEARPLQVNGGAPVRSGGTNAGAPFDLQVTAAAAQSTYAGIIRMVRAAEQSKAPFVRLADRYALVFLGLTVALAALAWIAEGSPMRALAVLVVATPCPLILAAPAAIIAGVSRAAKFGILIKGGGPLETLARVRVLLLDKTGTVTSARPQVVAVETFDKTTTNELVRLAASLEQVSVHPFAPAIISEARHRQIDLTFPHRSPRADGRGHCRSGGGSVHGGGPTCVCRTHRRGYPCCSRRGAANGGRGLSERLCVGSRRAGRRAAAAGPDTTGGATYAAIITGCRDHTHSYGHG